MPDALLRHLFQTCSQCTANKFFLILVNETPRISYSIVGPGLSKPCGWAN